MPRTLSGIQARVWVLLSNFLNGLGTHLQTSALSSAHQLLPPLPVAWVGGQEERLHGGTGVDGDARCAAAHGCTESGEVKVK